MSENLDPTEKIEKIKITTQTILSLPESFSFPNGWSLRELLIHLWSWDDQFLEFCMAKKSVRNKFQYAHEEEKLPYDKWNDIIIEKFEDMPFDEAIELFETTRAELINNLEKYAKLMVKKENEGKYDDIDKVMDFWQHDKMHLEAGGIVPYL